MTTTQMNEAMNHLVKLHVKPSFTLYEFVRSLDSILFALHDKEFFRDHDGMFVSPNLITKLPTESCLLNKYTFEAFFIYEN